MNSFNWKENIEDSLRDGLIITIGATRIFFGLEAANEKTTKGISRCYGNPKTCRWNLWRGAGERLCSLQKMDQ